MLNPVLYERPVIQKLLGDVNGLKILDLGSGTGNPTDWINLVKYCNQVTRLEHLIKDPIM
jgi:hypothetical protein